MLIKVKNLGRQQACQLNQPCVLAYLPLHIGKNIFLFRRIDATP